SRCAADHRDTDRPAARDHARRVGGATEPPVTGRRAGRPTFSAGGTAVAKVYRPLARRRPLASYMAASAWATSSAALVAGFTVQARPRLARGTRINSPRMAGSASDRSIRSAMSAAVVGPAKLGHTTRNSSP